MIVDYNILRKSIEKCDSKYRVLMKIMYLFGVRISELLPKKKGGEAIKGKHFSIVNVEGEEALQLIIPTSWQAGKSRQVVVPLNPKYEEWSKDILNLSEEKYNEKILDIVGRTLQQHISDGFHDLFLYERGYFSYKKGVKKYHRSRTDFLQTKHFKEIREVELVLTHSFTPYELKNYFGIKGYMNDLSYFRKLLTKSDIYINADIEGSIKLYKHIFNPEEDIYNNIYMDIQKMIKKEQIILLPIEYVNINENVPPSPKKGNDVLEHRLLKGNIKIMLEKLGSKEVSFEDANLDVVDFTNKIAVECGKSNGSKLLDLNYNVYQNIPNIHELWVLDYYDENNDSLLYKFILNHGE